MNKMDKLKSEYESIYASAELKERVNKIVKKKRVKFPVKALYLAAVFAVMFVSVFNIFPGLARAAEGVPALEQIFRVITFGKYENKEMGYEAKVTTPRVEGLLDKELENKLNEDFKESAAAVIYAYEKDVKELKKEFGDETVHMGVTSDYIIKADNEEILSLDVYILYTAGSSNTKHSFYTIDKKNGKLLNLEGLFKKDSDFITPISDYIKKEMLRQNKEEDGLFWVEEGTSDIPFETFEEIKKDQNFYINDKGELVICFDKYEVAAGAQGCPEFVIPREAISSVVSSKLIR